MGAMLWLLLLSALPSLLAVQVDNQKCTTCRFLTATFDKGLKATANKNFGGGDTAWEEKNLASFRTSEMRMLEILEGTCHKSTLANTDGYNDVKNLEFKCSGMMEDQEEVIEEYYKDHQTANMSVWMCEEKMALCCPRGRWGKTCSECPGLDGDIACNGRGDCHGDGSREGKGKCKCEKGYTGADCRLCDYNYVKISESLCLACHESCVGGCTTVTAASCKACKKGWQMSGDQGCVDIDECLSSPCGENESCVNTAGSHACNCRDGYKRVDGKCEIDLEAGPSPSTIRPDLLLRSVSLAGLGGCVLLAVTSRSPLLAFLTAGAVAAMVAIELYVNPDSIPDLAKNLF